MPRSLAVSAVAALAFVAAACTEGAPTSPDSMENSVFFSRGMATQDLGHLTSHGWACVPIPNLGVHCFAPGVFNASPSVSVLVYDTQDPADEDAPFLGTETLIHDDLYAGQPCPPEGLDEYTLLPASETGFPADYRACHHYSHDD